MAIFHFNAKTVSRSTGRSAVAAAAYRAAVNLDDDRTGLRHAFSRKRGVLDSFIVAPDGCDWALDRSRLWNTVEAAENRKNSTTAREYIVALPSELSVEECKQLLRAFTRALSDRYCIAIDATMHAPGQDGDTRNRHGHILTTTRAATPAGLTKKTRILDDVIKGPLEIIYLRGLWEKLTNQALAAAKNSSSVSAKSYATRSAEIEAEAAQVREKFGAHAWSQEVSDKAAILAATPTSHLGHRATSLERKAKRDAVKSGSVYEPQTEIGQINQQLRDARQEAFDAMRTLRLRESILKQAREQEDEALRAKLRAEKAATKAIADQQEADRIERLDRETEDRRKADQQPSQPSISALAPEPTATLPISPVKTENIPAPVVDQATDAKARQAAYDAENERIYERLRLEKEAAARQLAEKRARRNEIEKNSLPMKPAEAVVEPAANPPPKPKPVEAVSSKPIVPPPPEPTRSSSSPPVLDQRPLAWQENEPELEPVPEWPNIFPFTRGGRSGPLTRLYCHVMLNILDLKMELDAPDSQLKRLFHEAVRRLGPLLEGINAWINAGEPQVDQAAKALMAKRPDLDEIEQVILDWPAPQQQPPLQQAPIDRKGGKGPAD